LIFLLYVPVLASGILLFLCTANLAIAGTAPQLCFADNADFRLKMS
jgi:hypothetical protein